MNSNQDRTAPIQKHFRLYDEKDIVPEPQYRNELYLSTFETFERALEIVPEYYLVLSKDPYSWLISYKNWAHKCNWPNVSHHYIIEYNLFYAKWLEFSQQTKKILFIRYIDLLHDVNRELSILEAEMGLRNKLLHKFIAKNIHEIPQSGKFTEDNRNYYLSEKYLDSYKKKDLQEINELLDPRVISLLGYEKQSNVLS
ncbi:MAG: hypothetical protein K9L30_13470 [Desulfobacterales bacterium]|nr:hypothetical protein [Desulfobacterales bacterium]